MVNDFDMALSDNKNILSSSIEGEVEVRLLLIILLLLIKNANTAVIITKLHVSWAF